MVPLQDSVIHARGISGYLGKLVLKLNLRQHAKYMDDAILLRKLLVIVLQNDDSETQVNAAAFKFLV